MAASLERIEKDVRSMAHTIDEAKGGWKMLLMVGGAGGMLGGLLVSGWHQLR